MLHLSIRYGGAVFFTKVALNDCFAEDVAPGGRKRYFGNRN